MTKTAILAGLANSTRHYANDYLAIEPHAELWTLNRALMQEIVPCCDRFFEMHPIEMLLDDHYDPVYRDWITSAQHSYPVYMLEAYPEVHMSVPYPLDSVLAGLFGDIWRATIDDDGSCQLAPSNPYMTSTFSYMLGLAITEGFDRLYLPGFDMKTTTEYSYQKAGAEMLIGFAMARGIEIILPSDSAVMQALLYGYQGAQMISRQRLEAWQRSYQMQLSAATSEINKLMGLHEKLMREFANGNEAGITQVEAEQSADSVNQKIFEAQRVSGALSMIEKLIAECDLQEPGEVLPARLAKIGDTIGD